MLIHVDTKKFKVKPSKGEIGGIKHRLANPDTIQDVSVREVAAFLTAGQTIQPGVTPFSERSRKEAEKTGAKSPGTKAQDFTEQTLFMIDIDNDKDGINPLTPKDAAERLREYGLEAAFMYETFSSRAEEKNGALRFRIVIALDEKITDRVQRDRIAIALQRIFSQADQSVKNADRSFYGTNKGLIDEFTNFDAVNKKSDLIALADSFGVSATGSDSKDDLLNFADSYYSKSPEAESGEVIQGQQETRSKDASIHEGERVKTLISLIGSLIKKVPPKSIKSAIDAANKDFDPPLTEAELQREVYPAIKRWESEGKNAKSPDGNLEPSDYTDVGEARIFVEQYGSICRYSTATGWIVFDGKKWNESELKAQGLAQELTDRQMDDARKKLKIARDKRDALIEAGGAIDITSPDMDKVEEAKEAVKTAERYRGFILGRRKTSRIAATLHEARPSLEIDVKELDKNPFLLNTKGGAVDLRTGIMKPHDPNDFCTKITTVTPSGIGGEIWDSFLDRVTCGDISLRKYLQIIAGMSLVGKVFCENLIIPYGNGGNGKSTFFNIQFRVMGDYAGSLSAETLTVNCRKNKSPEYAELRGKRLVIAAELEEGMRLDTAVVKKLCSTDPIIAEKKFKDPFVFNPSHTTVLYTNHLPKVGTNDKGTWDRLVVVPFLAKLRGIKGEVKNYADYLFKHCGGAVLLWMVKGAKMFIDANYIIEQPQIVKDAIEAYRQENDWLNNFLTECCEVNEGGTAQAGEVYDAYKSHCSALNEYVRHAADLKAALLAAGFTWKKTKRGAMYYGFKLKGEALNFPRSVSSSWEDDSFLTG